MSRILYDDTMNKWFQLNLDEAIYSGEVFKDSEYDDPTYLTFKIEFGDWGASVLDHCQLELGTTTFNAYQADYDLLPMGLLNCPSLDDGYDSGYWQNKASINSDVFNSILLYSAFSYLRSRNEDVRAEYIYHFVNGLMQILKSMPYIFKKISGLDALEAFDPTKGRRLALDVELSLECIEGLDLKIKTLMELYRKAAWDDVYQQWVLPDNMREFKMIIYIFERRTFLKFTGDGLTLDNEVNYNIPVKAYECSPCEFVIGSYWGNEFDLTYENQEASTTIKIKVKNVKTYYKNGLLNTTAHTNYNSGIDTRLLPLFIYDLVDKLDRTLQNNSYDSDNDTSAGSDVAIANGNMTLNNVRRMFMTKKVFLEREAWTQNPSANLNWQNHTYGIISSIFLQNGVMTAGNSMYKQNLKAANLNNTAVFNESLVTTLYGGLGYSIPPEEDLYRLIEPLERDQAPMYKLEETERSIDNELTDYYKNVSTRQLDGDGFQQLNDPRTIEGEDMLYPIDGANRIEEDLYPLDPSARSIDHTMNKLKMRPRTISDDFLQMNDPRDIPDLDLLGMDGIERTIDDLLYTLNPSTRTIDDTLISVDYTEDSSSYPFLYMNDPRDPVDLPFEQMNNPRAVPNLSLMTPDGSTRNINDQLNTLNPLERPISDRFVEMNPPRELTLEELDILLQIERPIDDTLMPLKLKEREHESILNQLLGKLRKIPGMEKCTLGDVRTLPEDDLIKLIDETKDVMPAYKIDKKKLVTFAGLKDRKINDKLISLDKKIKDNEELLKKNLKENTALMTMTNVKTDDADAIRKLKLLLSLKEYTLNSDLIKEDIAKDTIAKKKDLVRLTYKVIEDLPPVEMYKIEKGQEREINDVLISLNDVKQILKNAKLISLEDANIRELSALTLISLNKEIDDEVKNTETMIGLTKEVEKRKKDKLIALKPENKKKKEQKEKEKKKRLGESAKLQGKDNNNNKIVY